MGNIINPQFCSNEGISKNYDIQPFPLQNIVTANNNTLVRKSMTLSACGNLCANKKSDCNYFAWYPDTPDDIGPAATSTTTTTTGTGKCLLSKNEFTSGKVCHFKKNTSTSTSKPFKK